MDPNLNRLQTMVYLELPENERTAWTTALEAYQADPGTFDALKPYLNKVFAKEFQSISEAFDEMPTFFNNNVSPCICKYCDIDEKYTPEMIYDLTKVANPNYAEFIQYFMARHKAYNPETEKKQLADETAFFNHIYTIHKERSYDSFLPFRWKIILLWLSTKHPKILPIFEPSQNDFFTYVLQPNHLDELKAEFPDLTADIDAIKNEADVYGFLRKPMLADLISINSKDGILTAEEVQKAILYYRTLDPNLKAELENSSSMKDKNISIFDVIYQMLEGKPEGRKTNVPKKATNKSGIKKPIKKKKNGKILRRKKHIIISQKTPKTGSLLDLQSAFIQMRVKNRAKRIGNIYFQDINQRGEMDFIRYKYGHVPIPKNLNKKR